MEDKNKKSILTEALTDYNEIMEAANLSAKNKLAEEFPEKFNQFLNEEKKKNKIAKESDKDSAKKIKESVITDKTNLNDESDMKNQAKETKEVANKNVVVDKTKKTLKEEFESNETMGDHSEFEEEGLNEFLTLDEIEAEIAKFSQGDEGEETDEETGEELDFPHDEETETPEEEEGESTEEEMLEKLVQLRDELNSVIDGLGGEGTGGEELGDEFSLDGEETGEEMGNEFGDETDVEIPDDEEINELLNQDSENEIEEAHGLSYSHRHSVAGRHLPDAAHLSKAELDQAPMQMQEANKRIKSLINENKELTKKVNTYKAKTEEINETVIKFKEAIGKYRKQLTEMAVFNTNIAHVNNILVNESLALTQEDKLRVINEFKSIGTITESQSKYKSILSEMTGTKKNITESVEDKLNTVINPSSKNKLDEVIEKTAYKNNEHIDKIKKLINYVERKNKF